MKKETLFYGPTDLPNRVNRSNHLFLDIFFSLVAKMPPPKNTKISQKSDFFEKKGKKNLVIFKNSQPNFLRLWLKLADLTRF